VSYLVQVQRGIDYIEDHLESDIDPAEVARHARISQWHFQRIFKALTNETLKTYIRSRRLAGALDALVGSDRRIIEIAMAAGFETQESFTRAFKKAFGVNPAAYRRQGRRAQFLRKVRFDAEYLRHLHHGISLEPELVELADLELVGLPTRFFSVDSEKNNLAQKLPVLWDAFLPRLGEVEAAVAGTCYGVVRQTPELTDELEYYAAIAVERTAVVPRGMVTVHLPRARYAVFTHTGQVARIDQTVNYIYSTWLASSGFRHTYAADLEIYDARYNAASEHSVIRYAIPIAPGEPSESG